MPLSNLLLLFCVAAIGYTKADILADNKTAILSRSPRYGYAANFENRLPEPPRFQNKFNDQSPPYPKFYDKPDRYADENPLPYEIPTGFDQFVPDKSSDPKYKYGPNSFYLPYPPSSEQDYGIQEIEEETKVPKTPSNSDVGFPSIKDLIRKVMNFFFGMNEPDSVDIHDRPTFLSVVKNIFKDPIVALSALFVPVAFFLASALPFFTKMIMSSSIVPAVTSTIANTVARGLESPAAEQILEAIGEFGSRAIEDPRCLQRMFCQAAKSHIESRSGDSWSAQKIIRKLAKAVDENLWDALGLKMLFRSLETGHCDSIPCNSELFRTDSGLSLMEKLVVMLSKLIEHTETVVL